MSNVASSPPDTPRVSANQIAEFVFASPAKKVAIATDQKFGNPFGAPYYQGAETALFQSFEAGSYRLTPLREAVQRIAGILAVARQTQTKHANNAEMVRRFIAVREQAAPPAGVHTLVRRNAFVELDGVWVSVRPEIVTDMAQSFSYTKWRFSKSRVSADASEIILQILIEFGRREEREEREFDLERTRLIDCYARSVIMGHELPALRERQLRAALREYAALWPNLEPPASRVAAAGR